MSQQTNTENSLCEQKTTSSTSLGLIKQDSSVSEDKLPNRVITRNRKLPIMRSKDVLW